MSLKSNQIFILKTLQCLKPNNGYRKVGGLGLAGLQNRGYCIMLTCKLSSSTSFVFYFYPIQKFNLYNSLLERRNTRNYFHSEHDTLFHSYLNGIVSQQSSTPPVGHQVRTFHWTQTLLS